MATPNEPIQAMQQRQKSSVDATRDFDVRQDGDSAGEGIVSDIIGLSFVYLMCLSFCNFILFFFNVLVSMHFIELFHASLVLILKAHTRF